ncbi:MAG: NAD(+)/NADH kinase [Clostridia bacterium]
MRKIDETSTCLQRYARLHVYAVYDILNRRKGGEANMNLVYLIMHQHKPNVTELSRSIATAFCNAGIAVSAEPWLYDSVSEDVRTLLCRAKLEDCEAVVSVGGDGTLLRANTLSSRYQLPLLGINMGTVGFLAEVEFEQLDLACKRLKANDFMIVERMMLKATLGEQTALALNDVVLSRGGYTRLIGVNAWVGEDQIGRYIADGLIVSTPTGSTGYSLSAGGPIVCPEVECMLLTPICAHSLQHRPVVTSAAQTICVKLDREHSPRAIVSIDGRQSFELSRQQSLYITQAQQRARFIRLEPTSFFSKIRVKLSEWSC